MATLSEVRATPSPAEHSTLREAVLLGATIAVESCFERHSTRVALGSLKQASDSFPV